MAIMDIEAIMKVLPHRYPFLMVDRIEECDDKTRIVAIKNVTVNEPFFQGHFPGLPVMPGVLQIEAMAQTGGILLSRVAGYDGQVPYFVSINNVKFRRVVKPGDCLRLEVTLQKMRSRLAFFAGQATVDGQRVSEADFSCMIGEAKVAGAATV